MNINTLGFLGGGRITRALVHGLLNAGFSAERIHVSDTSEEALHTLSRLCPGVHVHLNDNKAVAGCDVVFGAVPPGDIPQVLAEVSPNVAPHTLVVSLAPRHRLSALSQAMRGFQRLVRVIPNACSFVNAGFNPVAFSPALPAEEREAFKRLMKLLGEAPEVEEDLLEAYAVISAMGPTYFWFQWLEMVELAQQFGFSEEQAREAVYHTIAGAIRTLFLSGLSAEAVKDLIPVHPLSQNEEAIKAIFRERLVPLYERMKPA